MYDEEFPQNQLHDVLDLRTDHVMLINERGRADSMVSKTKFPLSKEKQEIFFMGSRLHQSLLQEFDEEFGQVEHFVICRRNVKILSIPIGSRNLISIMSNDSDHESVVRKIKAMMDHNFSKQEQKTLRIEVPTNG